MTYTQFRFTLGRIQAGLAKINGEEATLQSRELLIIGAQSEERGRVSVFDFDSDDLQRLLSAPSDNFFYRYESPSAKIRSVEIAYQHTNTDYPNELENTGVRVVSSSSDEMVRTIKMVQSAFAPYHSGALVALNFVGTPVLFFGALGFIFVVCFVGSYLLSAIYNLIASEPIVPNYYSLSWINRAAGESWWLFGACIIYILLFFRLYMLWNNFPVIMPDRLIGAVVPFAWVLVLAAALISPACLFAFFVLFGCLAVASWVAYPSDLIGPSTPTGAIA
jgi:hypothetical protein